MCRTRARTKLRNSSSSNAGCQRRYSKQGGDKTVGEPEAGLPAVGGETPRGGVTGSMFQALCPEAGLNQLIGAEFDRLVLTSPEVLHAMRVSTKTLLQLASLKRRTQ